MSIRNRAALMAAVVALTPRRAWAEIGDKVPAWGELHVTLVVELALALT